MYSNFIVSQGRKNLLLSETAEDDVNMFVVEGTVVSSVLDVPLVPLG